MKKIGVMKIEKGSFRQPKNRTFNYQPRFSKEKEEQAEAKRDFISQWKENSKQNRKVKGSLSIYATVGLLVLLLIGMYILNTYIK